MNCLEYVNLLSDYLEDDLDLKNRKMLEAHLQECDGCHQLFESFRSSVGLYETLEKEPCPPGLEQKLKGMIQQKIQNKKFSDS